MLGDQNNNMEPGVEASTEEISEEQLVEEQASGAPSADESKGDGALAGELEQAKAEALEAQEKLLRMAAEFENIKKRLQKEKEATIKYAEENILRELLPSIDHLEMAVNQDRNSENFGDSLLEGVEMTLNGLLSTLERYGLKPIDSEGEPFDPNKHEAIAMEESDEVPAQKIIKDFQKGYFFKDRLLRAAKVIVSKGSGN